VHGGAIALGHPLGASGARLAITTLHQLRARAAATASRRLASGAARASPPCSVQSRESAKSPLNPARLWDALAFSRSPLRCGRFLSHRTRSRLRCHPRRNAVYARLDGGSFASPTRRHVVFLDFSRAGASVQNRLPLLRRVAGPSRRRGRAVDVGEPRAAAANFARRYSLATTLRFDPQDSAPALFGVQGCRRSSRSTHPVKCAPDGRSQSGNRIGA